jgi:hypothetical protein
MCIGGLEIDMEHPNADILNWVAISGFDKYFVNQIGQVFSVPRFGTKGGLLKQREASNGYFFVQLSIGKSEHKTLLVHRLVANAFLPKVDGKNHVNHKNGIKSDNRLENLEWVTPSENVQHAYDTGLAKKAFGESSPSCKITQEMATQCNELIDAGMPPSKIAVKIGLSIGTVRAIKSGKGWSWLTGKNIAPKGTSRGRIPKTGLRGISLVRPGTYQVIASVKGQFTGKYVGRYNDLDDAIAAREAAEAHAKALLSFTEVKE